MRRIVTFNWMSADGYFSGHVGHLSWVVPDDEQRKRAARDISQFDTAIFGRKTYELFSQFWTKALDDPLTAPDPHLCPVVLGHGRPLLSNVPQPVPLALAESQRYSGGDVMLRYVRH
jgi:hypothetical protein